MTKRSLPTFFSLLLALLPVVAVANAGGGLEPSYADIGNRASLQRGAALYMNYCSGCHSLQYQRYSRMAEDLGLSEDQMMASLNFTGTKAGETIKVAMDPGDAEAWFAKTPPDLSLVARSRGADWIFAYLKSFYIDETRPLGWNNKLFPGASMPNVLWELQGIQRPVYGHAEHGAQPHLESLELASPGSLDAEQFDRVARDISAFLLYVGEPAAMKRESVGVWVILFLAFFTFVAWLLKKEFWRDVH
ncbi:MAG: cytochrome c1 [Xanthomonadales bacterium]|nr:cytochrome c1 [Xanthomonadales bacterium]